MKTLPLLVLGVTLGIGIGVLIAAGLAEGEVSMKRAIEIAEKIVAEYRALANMHAHEAQALDGLAREARMKLAEGCSTQADGAEIVLNALRAEAKRQAARIRVQLARRT